MIVKLLVISKFRFNVFVTNSWKRLMIVLKKALPNKPILSLTIVSGNFLKLLLRFFQKIKTSIKLKRKNLKLSKNLVDISQEYALNKNGLRYVLIVLLLNFNVNSSSLKKRLWMIQSKSLIVFLKSRWKMLWVMPSMTDKSLQLAFGLLFNRSWQRSHLNLKIRFKIYTQNLS